MTAGGAATTTVGTWLHQHTASAPEALRARVRDYTSGCGDRTDVAAALAGAAADALANVLVHPGDRSAALDLLAADALVTLALLAQAEGAPGHLGAFADRLLRMHLPTR